MRKAVYDKEVYAHLYAANLDRHSLDNAFK
jgi:hypothetical protein